MDNWRMLKLRNISYAIGEKRILQNISVSFEPGKIHMILGPNGSGKSSLLKIFSGETKNYIGDIEYENKNIRLIQTLELAKRRAVLSQQPHLQFPLLVHEVIMMGRYPHFNFNPSKEDEKICDEVINTLKLGGFRNRDYTTLSGGEKQRVQYARVLAQIWESKEEMRFLFLDEPLNNLDIKYQKEFLDIAKLFLNKQTTIIAIIHDINLAIRYADELHFMKEGRLIASGKSSSLLSEELINDVFEIDSKILKTDEMDFPVIVLK
jgi:iron complex transport system ATP-binding protein